MSDKTHTKIVIALLALMIYPEVYLVFRYDSEGLAAKPGQKDLQEPLRVEHPPVQASAPGYPPPTGDAPSKDAPWGKSVPTWSDQHSQALSRSRTNSIDSGISVASTATTSSTVSGWKTPKATNTNTFGQQQTPGYASGFSRLALEDVPVGRTITGPRDRNFGDRRR